MFYSKCPYQSLHHGTLFLKDFIEQQQHGFSDLTPRAGSHRLLKSAKSLLGALLLLSISQIAIQKCGSGHFDPF